MGVAVKVEGLGKRFILGQTFENTLSGRIGGLLRGRGLAGRAPAEEFWALRDVSFDIGEGEAVGIIGGNGAGKSTLLKVLSRITPPTRGRALVKGRLSSLLEVGTGFHPELTGRENVFLNGAILGMRKSEVERKFDEIVAFSGVEKFIDTPVKRYSSGMYVRLAFAVAAHLEPDVLIIDEVLAVGDAEFQKRCMGKMGDVAREGRTVIFVSHNMTAVQRLCSRAVWLDAGRVRQFDASDAVVASYLESAVDVAGGDGALPPGYLYRNESLTESAEASIRSVQLVDAAGMPLRSVRTWQPAGFRIEFSTTRAFRSIAAEMNISTTDGVTLIRTATSPDHAMPLSADPGRHCIDCFFDQLPMAAGDYVVGASLAIPGTEYLTRNDSLCRLTVSQEDIFGSTMAPLSSRYFVATPHRWRTLESVGS
ncbi:ABC transporter ATP-binding protein [Arenimonas sp.]|uniref:ABC transporter ATP-binding protein n=1 Tax=Arenimonas sp. TaxID=1872635 RepID=UPI0039E2B315